MVTGLDDLVLGSEDNENESEEGLGNVGLEQIEGIPLDIENCGELDGIDVRVKDGRE